MACHLFGAKPLPEPDERPRWFETSWGPCCVTVITKLQNAISVLQMITSPIRECGVCFVISQDMLLNNQSIDWWSRRSCGVTVITTPFRYYRWLRLQWESADVFFAISKGYCWTIVKRLSVWNVVALRLCHCNNVAIKHNSILQMITSLIREFRCLFWSQPGHAVEQLVKRSEIWDTMTLDHVRSVTVKTMLQNKARFLQRQTRTSAWEIS